MTAWDREAIERALPAWISARPWAHGAQVSNPRILALIPIPGTEARLAIVKDDERAYAIPMTAGEPFNDALALPEVGEALVAATGESKDAEYTLRFHANRRPNATRWVAKIIHVLECGESPELEVVRFLTAAGFRYVAPLAGWIDVSKADGPGSTVAVIEGYVSRNVTALDHLRTELHRWFDEILQMGDIDPPKLSPNDILSRALFPLADDVLTAVGPYVRTAALLGTRVGEMHKLLARTNVDAFAPEALDAASRDAIVKRVKTAVGDAFAVLDVRSAGLPPKAQAAITALRAKMPNLEKRVNALSAAPEGAVRIRTHGNLRLDRVLYTGGDFVVDGFEGDRSQPFAARKAKRSPIEDVATMLRSFHREVTRILAERPQAQRAKLFPWSSVFHRAASASFLGGWLRSASESTVLPAAPVATRALLDCLLIDACVRELDAENETELEVGLEGLREVLDNERKPGQIRTSRSFSPFAGARAVMVEPSRLDPEDAAIKSFKQGTATHAQRIFGAKHRSDGSTEVAVYAPNAIQVAVVGDFNDWNGDAGLLHKVGETGIYAGRVRGARVGQRYMFRIPGVDEGPPRDKADPFAAAVESGGKHASLIAGAEYRWGDAKWMQARRQSKRPNTSPLSILEIEVDAGYRDIALSLAARVKANGFTHVELLFPRDAFFAPAVKYGSTEDLMFLVDTLHQDGIGVFFAWSIAGFVAKDYGLTEFDGMPLYESDDSSRVIHPVTGMGLFDLGKPEAQSLLLSSALFWIEELHADGLRIDDVATAVYLDDRRAPGTWSPNAKGGRENLEGVAFVQRLTKALKSTHPDVLVFADDSAAAWSNITASAEAGGLGFDRRCDTTFVDDLRFHLSLDARGRAHHDVPLPAQASTITTVDEVTAAETLDTRSRKILLALAWALPGKKLLFAQEDGETTPTVADLNRVYQTTPAFLTDEITPIDEPGKDLIAFRRGEAVVVANLGNDIQAEHMIKGKWRILYDLAEPAHENQPGQVVEHLTIPPRSVLFLVPA
jgi:1,4-alpha-glucan branching enzyme